MCGERERERERERDYQYALLIWNFFPAADDFDLPGLKPLCMNRLCTLTPIAVDNVVDVFVEAMRQPVQGINSYKLPFRLKISLYS